MTSHIELQNTIQASLLAEGWVTDSIETAISRAGRYNVYSKGEHLIIAVESFTPEQEYRPTCVRAFFPSSNEPCGIRIPVYPEAKQLRAFMVRLDKLMDKAAAMYIKRQEDEAAGAARRGFINAHVEEAVPGYIATTSEHRVTHTANRKALNTVIESLNEGVEWNERLTVHYPTVISTDYDCQVTLSFNNIFRESVEDFRSLLATLTDKFGSVQEQVQEVSDYYNEAAKYLSLNKPAYKAAWAEGAALWEAKQSEEVTM
ncbi:MAG: hypothetical protein GY753_06925 [Gammaproteobacteria bacterium]|nr:hypothetical protein [Gammaproteobacteria bacterium]